MLMMVDPNVHFHVIPRYSGGREWSSVRFPDHGWPGVPDLPSAVALDGDQIAAMRDVLARLS
jgi:diadenosine tetraphosphate (Ap4A) HIT family hydrolase